MWEAFAKVGLEAGEDANGPDRRRFGLLPCRPPATPRERRRDRQSVEGQGGKVSSSARAAATNTRASAITEAACSALTSSPAR